MINLDNKLYTSTEVAEVLGVSLRSVYRYIEEGKLIAEVKTATGRHRFTKQNIIDFLYPSGNSATQNNQSVPQTKRSSVKATNNMEEEEPVDSFETRNPMTAPRVAPRPTRVFEEPELSEEDSEIESEDTLIDDTDDVEVDSFDTAPVLETRRPRVTQEPKPVAAKNLPEADLDEETEEEEEPIDWLAKFREAARRLEEENSTKEQEQPVRSSLRSTEIKSSLPEEEEYEPETVPAKTSTSTRSRSKMLYYTSRLGGLREIAQNIDKSARNMGLDYAFTMNAGLSLFKALKPFSMLHVYMRSNDIEFFERSLQLNQSEESEAQLCIIVSDEHKLYDTVQEVHGLSVVSNGRLLRDIETYGDQELLEDADSVLS